MGTSLCDVTMTLKHQGKIVNVFFLKQDTYFYKYNVQVCLTLLPKNAHGITQRPTLIWVLGGIFHFFFSNLERKAFKQTAETLIRHRLTGRLIWVCNVFLCSTNSTLGLYGFRMQNGINTSDCKNTLECFNFYRIKVCFQP